MMNEDILVPDITITGNYPALARVKTGLFSFDYSLSQEGNLGVPLRVIVELYGYTNSGKSTLAYFVGGKVSDELKKSVLPIADLEMADVQGYVPRAVGAGGFKGEVRMMDVADDKGKPISHEKILMQLAKSLLKEETGVVIWDSVGATQAMVQMDVLTDPKAIFGEAFMGRRASLVGAVSLALRTALIAKDGPSSAIAINHTHSVIGGRGHTTPGGERLKFLAGVRLMIWPAETFKADDNDPTSDTLGFLVRGQVEKLRFGGRGRHFQFYIVPGHGIHPGVTAMFDAFDQGLAERGARVKLDGKSLGFLKADLLSYAAEGKRRKFYPFQEVMNRYTEDVERGNVQVVETNNPGTEDK
jgi:RecA/RadA recombinase